MTFTKKKCGAPTYVFVGLLKNDVCVYCGDADVNVKKEIEHVFPRSWFTGTAQPPGTGFGKDHWTNLSAACKKCNTKRGNKPLLRFLVERMKECQAGIALSPSTP